MRQSPAPNAYQLPSTYDAKEISLSGRHAIIEKNSNPGPGTYNLCSTLNTNNAASLASRTQQNIKSRSPGPGTYSPLKMQRTMSPTLGARTSFPGTMDWELKKKIGNPAGNQYDIKAFRSTISSSFGQRTSINQVNSGPGPAKYNVREVQSNATRAGSPSYTLRGRTKNIQEIQRLQNTTIGPANYSPGTINARGKESISKNNGITLKGRPANRGIVVFV